MTAPTPEYETWMWAEMGRLQDALATVITERDQAIRELAEQKRVNMTNLRAMVKEADQVQEQLDQARQMLDGSAAQIDVRREEAGRNWAIAMDAMTDRDRARASSVLWGTIVTNVERAIDAHAFDDEDGNGFVPIGPLQDALNGKKVPA